MKNVTSNNFPIMAMTAAGLLLAVTLTAGVTATPATAQHACEPDAHRLCSQFIPNEQDVANCLRQKAGKPERRLPRRHGRRQSAKRAARKKARSN